MTNMLWPRLLQILAIEIKLHNRSLTGIGPLSDCTTPGAIQKSTPVRASDNRPADLARPGNARTWKSDLNFCSLLTSCPHFDGSSVCPNHSFRAFYFPFNLSFSLHLKKGHFLMKFRFSGQSFKTQVHLRSRWSDAKLSSRYTLSVCSDSGNVGRKTFPLQSRFSLSL